MTESTHFLQALERTLGVEGGFSDHAADRGGATRFGITEAVARRHGYAGSMRELPAEVARRIYHEDYWLPLRLDSVAQTSPEIAEELFDTGVNAGPGRAAEYLQRALNLLNDRQRYWRDLRVDGAVGEHTLSALRACGERRGKAGLRALLRLLNILQGYHYVALAERDESQEAFMLGWIDKRIALA